MPATSVLDTPAAAAAPAAAAPAAAAQETAYDLTVGVEIEAEFPSSTGYAPGQDRLNGRVNRAIRDAGFPVTDSGCGTTGWNVGLDCSCGAELRSPVFETVEDATRQITKVCEILRDNGYRATDRCGGHVHLGTGVKTQQEVYKFHQYLLRHEEALFSLVPRSRRNNPHVTPILRSAHISSNVAEIITRGYRPNQSWFYRAWFHQSDHCTTEIRTQAGSLDPEYILSWIAFLQQTWRAAQASTFDPQWRMHHPGGSLLVGRQAEAPLSLPKPKLYKTAAKLLRPGGASPFLASARNYYHKFHPLLTA